MALSPPPRFAPVALFLHPLHHPSSKFQRGECFQSLWDSPCVKTLCVPMELFFLIPFSTSFSLIAASCFFWAHPTQPLPPTQHPPPHLLTTTTTPQTQTHPPQPPPTSQTTKKTPLKQPPPHELSFTRTPLSFWLRRLLLKVRPLPVPR